jgi:ABC-type phosphate transport system substrate-binding protein
MRKVFIAWALLSVMQITSIAMANAEDITPVIAVIVANSQNIDELKLTQNNLSLIYWRTQLYWPKGQRIKPVNLRAEHPLRLQFSQKILGTLPKQQIDYWNGLYFNGISPPHVVDSEEAVIRYVSDTKGSIGYIDACLVDSRVKAIFWIDHDKSTTSTPSSLNCQ